MAPGILSDQSNAGIVKAHFQRPVFQVVSNPEVLNHETIRSLPDLLEFNDRNNPHHTFALQQVKKDGEHVGFQRISFRVLKQAVDSCAEWINDNLARTTADDLSDVSSGESRPIALFLESDLTLFIHFCALLWMEIPVRPLSYLVLMRKDRNILMF